ncbi:hypothetical protein GW17_00014513 [Ensete ventricosum]|nr:hypothetical protein GW17_00014513 [Ensete ventricosum]
MGRRLVAAARIALTGGYCDREGGCGSSEGYSRGGGLQPKVRMWLRRKGDGGRRLGREAVVKRIGSVDSLLEPQVGCKCKLALKLLELLMRSVTANKTSEKLGILRQWRRCNLERRLGKEATRRDLQRWKPALLFLKRVWRNSTKVNEGFSG